MLFQNIATFYLSQPQSFFAPDNMMIILFVLGSGEVSDTRTREEAFETYEARTWEE